MCNCFCLAHLGDEFTALSINAAAEAYISLHDKLSNYEENVGQIALLVLITRCSHFSTPYQATSDSNGSKENALTTFARSHYRSAAIIIWLSL